MSNVTIPDLPPGAGPTAASQFESVEGVASVRYTAAQIVGAGASGAFLTKANNLSDVPDKAAARTNLGLGNVENKSSATIRSEITSANVTGALGYTPLNPASNLSDVASVATARTNLGITASGADVAYVWRTNNLSDLTNITTARTNLGLGTAAVKNTGTSGNTVPLLDGANTFSGATNVFNGNVGIGTGATIFAPLHAVGIGVGGVYAATIAVEAPDNPKIGMLCNAGFQWSTRIATTGTPGNGEWVLRYESSNLNVIVADRSGNVLIGNTSPIASEKFQVAQAAAGSTAARFMNHNATPGPTDLIVASFFSSAPNAANSAFAAFVDNVALRMYLKSDGGLSNYSANNVNLSDANVKDQITPYSKTELAALEQSFTDVIWGKFKYRDQTHDDWNHGPTAQGVERAFEKTAPELVDESELGTKPESGVKHKVIYETDLAHIAHALLAKALTEIADLKMRLAKVGA